ncbi:hypothetical protein [Oceaniglobus indicus]|uniref:hypothetical protein n=1 Tax=Oceaniglobus indicus TaxID=2047749 RepID=UPI0011AB5377|nr:hypothetical protein [Oceaniglobus indicus]
MEKNAFLSSALAMRGGAVAGLAFDYDGFAHAPDLAAQPELVATDGKEQRDVVAVRQQDLAVFD